MYLLLATAVIVLMVVVAILISREERMSEYRPCFSCTVEIQGVPVEEGPYLLSKNIDGYEIRTAGKKITLDNDGFIISSRETEKSEVPLHHFEVGGEKYSQISLSPHVVIDHRGIDHVSEDGGPDGTPSQAASVGEDLSDGEDSFVPISTVEDLPSRYYVGVSSHHGRHEEKAFYAFEKDPPFSILKRSERFLLPHQTREATVLSVCHYNHKYYVLYSTSGKNFVSCIGERELSRCFD